MSEILKALQDLPWVDEKKHFVNVDGKTVEVSLEKKLEVIKHGEDAWILKGGEVVLKPKPIIKTTYKILKKHDKGYSFLNGDIHWPNEIIEEGYTWQIESE